jgi:hypothetical protein
MTAQEPRLSAETVAGLHPGMFPHRSQAGIQADYGNPEWGTGYCSICDDEVGGTHAQVDEWFVAHNHDVLAEARYYLDAWPETFGQRYTLMEKLWRIAARYDGSESGA